MKEVRRLNLHEKFGHEILAETERIKIGIIKAQYINDYMEYYSGKDMCRFLDWNGPEDINQAIQYFCMWEKEYMDGEILPLAIIDKSTEKMIGSIIFSDFIGLRTNIGYELAQEYWNEGIMSEALGKVIPIIFNEVKVKRIQAIVFEGNIASEKVLLKQGFIKEGLLKKYSYHVIKEEAIDSFIYSLTK